MSCRFKSLPGFTLVEMIVVIAIFGIVTVVVLANLPVFRDRTSLDLVAQEVAIHLRGAQVFGAGGRVGATATTERPTYGIHFTETTSGQAVFKLFRDIPDSTGEGNNAFDEGTGKCSPGNFLGDNDDCELEQTYTVSKGFRIYKITVDGTNANEVDVLFTRPKLEPVIAVNGNAELHPEFAEIIIQSLRTQECRNVKIWNNGQIAVLGVEGVPGCKNNAPQS